MWKRGTPKATKVKSKSGVAFPTPWNQLEAGILFALSLPLIVFRESAVSGGVFDVGSTDLFVHTMPVAKPKAGQRKALRDVLRKWSSQAQAKYYAS
jgi:hypothetical protein